MDKRDKLSYKTTLLQTIFRILLGLNLCMTGIGHLTTLRKEFLAQVPTWLPINGDFVVVSSGVVEILLGLSLIFLAKYRIIVGWLTAIFFILIFPGNISQYVNHIDAFGLDTDLSRGIRLLFQPVLVLWALWSTGALKEYLHKRKSNDQEGNNHFYNFKAQSLQNQELSMATYAGKVVLVVNTASKCGLAPQLNGLESLYQKYKDQGLVVLGFPSNQFANQEPGDSASITEECVINYGVSFPMFSKIEVNGQNAHPIYKYLKNKLSGILGGKIKWNFTKFLIDREGNPVKRFSPIQKPESIEPEIVELLKS